MSTPLFIREIQVGVAGKAILGTVGISANSDWTILDPFYNVQEQTLIEEVRFCANAFSTEAGQLLIAIVDEDYGGSGVHNIIHAHPIGAGSSTLFATGSVKLDLSLAPTFSLAVHHDAKVSGGMSYASFWITAFGGVTR